MSRRRMMYGGKANKNTLLLLHFDGDLTDSSPYGRVYTEARYLTSTTPGKFTEFCVGTSSSRGRLSYNFLDFSFKDVEGFTLEWFEYQAGYSIKGCNFYLGLTATGSGTNVAISGVSDNKNVALRNASMQMFSLNKGDSYDEILGKWVHYALVFNGTNAKAFRGGVLVDEITYDRSVNFLESEESRLVRLFNFYDNASASYFLKMNEFRISNIARYTENFTPPTEPFE